MFLLGFGGATLACAQSTPEMREILNRLERLEEENQALNQEIHALRQDLAAQRGPATDGDSSGWQTATAEPQSSTSTPLEERLALQQNRIDEMAQT